MCFLKTMTRWPLLPPDGRAFRELVPRGKCRGESEYPCGESLLWFWFSDLQAQFCERGGRGSGRRRGQLEAPAPSWPRPCSPALTGLPSPPCGWRKKRKSPENRREKKTSVGRRTSRFPPVLYDETRRQRSGTAPEHHAPCWTPRLTSYYNHFTEDGDTCFKWPPNRKTKLNAPEVE